VGANKREGETVCLRLDEMNSYLSPFRFPFRVSFNPEDLRIEGNPVRVNPSPFYGEGDRG
jgi:hypothetical protein